MTAAQHRRDLTRLRRVRDRIDREYAQPLDVDSLARGENMSTRQLSRDFEIAYGESLWRHLMTRRIGCAVALLRRGDLSVTAVSLAVGCTSVRAFSGSFTELVGVPPGAYRSSGSPPPAACIASGIAARLATLGRNREAAVPARA